MNIILNQLTYFAFFQSILLIVIYLISFNKRRKINPYLFILVCVLLIGLSGKIIQITEFANLPKRWASFSEFSILLFGPTVYLFTVSTLSNKQAKLNDIYHYIPGIIYSFVILFYYILPSQEIINARYESGELIRMVRILVGIGLTVNITYFIKSILKFGELKNILQDEVSYALNISFLKKFLMAIGLCLTIWVVVYFISFGPNILLEINARVFIWLAIALIVLFLSYYQMVSPAVFVFEELKTETKYVQSKFSKSQLDELKTHLETIMENKKPYLNSKLLKSELAELLGVNSPELARLLNERIGMNFFEFVNYYRIHEFIRLAKTPKVNQMTLLAIAQESGFNSKATFNKSFKKIMGCSPSAYLKK